MALWKDIQGRFHDDMDGAARHLLPKGCVAVTQIEFDALVAPTLQQKKDTAWQLIKAKRDFLTRNGGFHVGTKWYHSDEFSRGQHLGLLAMGANMPSGLLWKTMDGSFVTMTQAIASQILAAAAASDQAIFTAAETHKAAMEAASDPSSYDFSASWPVTFLG